MQRGKLKIVAITLVIVVVLGTLVVALFALLFPAPMKKDPGIPTLYPYVNDKTGVLSEYYSTWIDDICYEVDANSSCEMAVLVVNNTQPYSIDYFSVRAFQYNGIGEEGKDNGVLIVLSVDDGNWRIEIGYGLQGILPATVVKELGVEDLDPAIENGTYEEGLLYLTADIGQIIVDQYQGDRSGTPAYPTDFIPLDAGQWAIAIIVVILLMVITKGRILWPIIWILGSLGGSRGGFGGGRSGGGGARR